MPDAARLDELIAAKPSIADLSLDGNTVTSGNKAVALDFGGYLKGVALDRAAAMLKARGIANALINIGGNVLALGAKGDTPWRVGIQHPRQAAPLATLDAARRRGHWHLGRLPALFRAGWQTLLPPDRPAYRPAERGHRGGDGADPAGTASGHVVGRGQQAAVHRRPRLARLADKLGTRQVLRVDDTGRIEVTAAFRQRLEFADAKTAVVVLP